LNIQHITLYRDDSQSSDVSYSVAFNSGFSGCPTAHDTEAPPLENHSSPNLTDGKVTPKRIWSKVSAGDSGNVASKRKKLDDAVSAVPHHGNPPPKSERTLADKKPLDNTGAEPKNRKIISTSRIQNERNAILRLQDGGNSVPVIQPFDSVIPANQNDNQVILIGWNPESVIEISPNLEEITPAGEMVTMSIQNAVKSSIPSDQETMWNMTTIGESEGIEETPNGVESTSASQPTDVG